MRKVLLSGLIAISLISCFDLKESIVIESEEKVSIEYSIRIDSLLASMMDVDSTVKQLQKSAPHAHIHVRDASGGIILTVRYPPVPYFQAVEVDSTLNITPLRDRLVLRKYLGSHTIDTLGIHTLFKGRVYVFEIRSKKKILKSNAHVRIGDTLHRWVFPLDSLLLGTSKFRIEAEIER